MPVGADVVLYDRLTSTGSWITRDERKSTWAAPRNFARAEAICCCWQKAREGKSSRLKWGDPYVFDHGAEAFLREQGVRFEVVPGIPAGIGAASYAGCHSPIRAAATR